MFNILTQLVFIATLASSEVHDQIYSGGRGTIIDPYQISSIQDLNKLSVTSNDYNKHFILITDIDLDPKLPNRKYYQKAVIAPDINNCESEVYYQGTRFSGSFDGQGHEIRNLCLKGSDYLGFFGCISNDAKVVNLGLRNVMMIGTGSFIGSLVGKNEGKIVNCFSTGKVTGTYWSGGGLVGCNNGSVSSCFSTGIVDGKGLIGGLVGTNNGGTIMTSYSICTIKNNEENGHFFVGGGLVGDNLAGAIVSCYSTGEILNGISVGGLVGRNRAGGTIKHCFWDTDTSGLTQSALGTGLPTVLMQDINTYLDADWDFDTVWMIPDADYPQLQWQEIEAQENILIQP